MTEPLRGSDDGSALRIGVVVSRFHEEITDRLARDCLGSLASFGVLEENIVVVSVPGAF